MASKLDSYWEPLPSYLELASGVYNFCSTYTTPENRHEFSVFHNIETVLKHHRIHLTEVVVVLLLATVWTVLRHYVTKFLFKPLGAHYGLTLSNQDKMPESAWKLSYYFISWSATAYVVWTNGFFQRPSSVWDDWSLDSPVLPEVYAIYILQSSFYLHALYATAFQDTWRKDSLVLQAHHLLTLALLGFSHAFRYNKIGVLVLVFHDISDIQLEFTKLNVYFKIQHNNVVLLHDQITNLGYVSFMITWFISRLYWFPLKALHAAAITTHQKFEPEQMPFLLYINGFLWLLLAMNVYWFVLIMMLAVRMAAGQIKEVDDTREYDVEEKIQHNLKMNKIKSLNGDLKHQNGDTFKNGSSANHQNVIYRATAKQRSTGDGG